jgi:hypothetical protein
MTGVQAALQFLGTARRDDALRRELEHLADGLTFDDLVALAQQRGLSFTEDDLTRAHVIDWRLRQAHYGLR